MMTSAEARSTGARGLLVTGGTQGIGLAVALRLAKRMAPVYLLSLDAISTRDTVDAAFRDRGLARPILLEADVADREQLTQIAEDLARNKVDIGTVVASAGINVRALALEVGDDAVRSMINTNLYGLFLTFQVFAPLVLARPNGRFIALSSLSAIYGQRLRAVYAATKAGVSGLVRALATEWSPMGATVNAIAPGISQNSPNQRLPGQPSGPSGGGAGAHSRGPAGNGRRRCLYGRVFGLRGMRLSDRADDLSRRRGLRR